MAKVTTEAYIDFQASRRGILVAEIVEGYDRCRKFLVNLAKYEKKKSETAQAPERRRISLTLETYYGRRSPAQNALMWALYDILAEVENGGRSGEGTVSPEDLYERDAEHNPTFRVHVLAAELDTLKQIARVVTTRDIGDGQIEALCEISSSGFNSRQMHDRIEMLFDRLADADVTLDRSEDIGKWWRQHRLDAAKDEAEGYAKLGVVTIAEYAKLHRRCEACGRPFTEDHPGSVAHVKAVGMGGGRESKVSPAEVMRLCDEHHAMYDNGKGRAKFLEAFPHLTIKVNAGVGKEIAPEPSDELEIW